MTQGVFINQEEFDEIKTLLKNIESLSLKVIHQDQYIVNYTDNIIHLGKMIFNNSRKLLSKID